MLRAAVFCNILKTYITPLPERIITFFSVFFRNLHLLSLSYGHDTACIKLASSFYPRTDYDLLYEDGCDPQLSPCCGFHFSSMQHKTDVELNKLCSLCATLNYIRAGTRSVDHPVYIPCDAVHNNFPTLICYIPVCYKLLISCYLSYLLFC